MAEAGGRRGVARRALLNWGTHDELRVGVSSSSWPSCPPWSTTSTATLSSRWPRSRCGGSWWVLHKEACSNAPRVLQFLQFEPGRNPGAMLQEVGGLLGVAALAFSVPARGEATMAKNSCFVAVRAGVLGVVAFMLAPCCAARVFEGAARLPSGLD